MSSKFFIAPEVLEAVLMDDGPAAEIAERHGISRSAVGLVKRLRTKKARKVEATLRSEGKEPVVWRDGTGRHNFTPEQIDYIRASDKPSTAMAEEAGCSPSMIRMIRLGRTYT